jgi:hypothetical protein
MSYRRVIPRDLFNEAKLLKCLGKLSLLIHEQMIDGLNVNHEDELNGFKFSQCTGSGFITVSNLHFFDNNGTPIYCYHPLNCKDKWPMQIEYLDEIYWPFNEQGEYQLSKKLFKDGEE